MKIWIRGAGDLATGIASRLYRSGHQLLMTELPVPLTVRRTVALSRAVYEQHAEVEDMSALLVHSIKEALEVQAIGKIPVIIEEPEVILKEYQPERIITVFGCGGNRSKTRRYEMGEVSGKLADFTIITSDNPRFEEPEAIMEDIKTGISKTDGKHIDIVDRKEAIKYSIEHAKEGDVILLIGKGHEDYLEIKGVKYHLDEREVIADIIADMNK